MSKTLDYTGKTYDDYNGKKIRDDFDQILKESVAEFQIFDDEIILHPDGMSCEEEDEGEMISYDVLPDIVIELDKEHRIRKIETEYHVSFESKECDVRGTEWLPKEEVQELLDGILE